MSAAIAFTKPCAKCGLNWVPTEAQVRHRYPWCRPCTRAYEHQRRWTFRANGIPEKRDDPSHLKARSALRQAVRNGKVKRLACFCGEAKSEGHHDDYDKPLDVVWLCRRHHQERHTKPTGGARETAMVAQS